MKKHLLSISIILLLILLVGCKKDDQTKDNGTPSITPTTAPVVTLPAQVTPQDNPSEASNQEKKIEDYFPLKGNTEYIYEGEGNEYASFRRYIDFIDLENQKYQTRTNNGGTETVRVLEMKDGKLTVINQVNECYYRENLLDKVGSKTEEIILMEPLVLGTKWTLSDQRVREITNEEAQIVTPLGSYKALEVTTKEKEGTTKDYYAYGVGLVMTIYEAEGMKVTSSLSDINTQVPYIQTIDVFYPDADEKIYVEPVMLTFFTDDDTKQILEETLKKDTKKETFLPLASVNTKVNSLYLGEDQVVYVDFTKEFANEMNAGAGYELLILQSITNTLGNYYGVNKVSISLEGKPYESGHILMKQGEALEVNMDNVVR